MVIRRELDSINDGTTAYCNLTLLVAKIAYKKSGVRLHTDFKITIQVGNCTCLGILSLDCCTNQRFTLIIYNLSLDCDHLVLCNSSHCGHWGNKRSATNSTKA